MRSPCRRWLLWAAVAFLATCLPPGSRCQEPVKPRVLLLGVDGASWKIIGPMLDRGELPAFGRLSREGAYSPDFETLEGGASPLIWTTIATGRTPADHGIDSFVTDLGNGAIVPITSSSRKARAIWEIAGMNGLTAGVIGYWASWPAERIRGYVVSDHANAAFSEFMAKDGRLWKGPDPARLSQLQRDFYPLDLESTLAAHWVSTSDFSYDDMQRRTGYNAVQTALLREVDWNVFSDYYSLIKTMYRVDYPLFAVAKDLMVKRPTDLLILYLHGPDPVQHMAWDLAEPEAYEVPNPNLERDRGLVEGIYRSVDSMLADLLELTDEDTWVIVASDHGIEAAPAATGNPRQGRPGEHPESAKGVLFVHGPHVKAGYRIEGATPFDLMPTMAWLLGLPISEELEGRPLVQAFDSDFVSSQQSTRVASYGERPISKPQASPADRLKLDLLETLGYISN